MRPAAVPPPIRRFQVLAGALMGALFVIGVALAFVVGGGSRTNRDGRVVVTHAPATWVYVVIVVLGVVAAVLVQTLGYRLPALPPGEDPAVSRRRALVAFQSSMVLRFAVSESVAIVSIALLFASASNTLLPYLLGAAISLVLMLVHVWPSSRVVARVARRLERAGGRSDLSAVLAGTV